MMKYYDIVSLIVFLKKQSQNEFQGIIELIEILDNKDVSHSEKGDLLTNSLRKQGLREVDLPDFDEKINIDQNVIPGEIHWRKYSKGKYQLDLYICILLDGKKRFIQNLN